MAVQKSKKTRSKIGMRRSNKNIKIPVLSSELFSKEIHIRHHISKSGFYKGKKII